MIKNNQNIQPRVSKKSVELKLYEREGKEDRRNCFGEDNPVVTKSITV